MALGFGSTIYLCGGLTGSGSTTGSIVEIDLGSGTLVRIGALVAPVHDAGGATLNGVGYVFGGGRFGPGAVVQRVGATGSGHVVGSLPAVRADLAAVVVGNEIVVVGGGTPASPDHRVLATTDGRRFQVVAQLLVGVRYPAVATIGGLVYVIGGSTPTGDTSAIQVVDPATGKVHIAGHLAHSLSHASAVVLAGRILVAGGQSAGRAQSTLWLLDASTGSTKQVGRLPYAVSDSAAIVVGDVAYLIGGEGPGPLASIISISVR